MKISDFEIGKKYIRESWKSKTYVEYDEKDDGNYVLLVNIPFLGEHLNKIYIPNFKDTSADDWIEFKEAENDKEMLCEHDCPIKNIITLLELMARTEAKKTTSLEAIIKNFKIKEEH